ncbi:hypothetical protein IIC65_07900, partial [Candidatus Sumerlaeota bacterium]|nr:hypothetical protein [Candidatus Sumerlaeota bacterium]
DLELQLWIVQGEEFPEDPADVKDFANKFMATGWEKMPPNPASDNPWFPGFAIWPGQEPFVEDALGEKHLNEFFCLSELLAADRIVAEFGRALAEAENYKLEHDGECPPSLTAANVFFLRYPNDPWGGEFAWDPEECKAYSTTFERIWRKSTTSPTRSSGPARQFLPCGVELEISALFRHNKRHGKSTLHRPL